ncbi:hypothetical protein ACHWQZ_G004304 [Mnemiopsis leidyi]
MGLAEDLIGTQLNDLETLERMESEIEKSKEKNASSRKKSTFPEKQILKIDEILSRSGGFARYQIFLVLCLGLGGALYVSVQNLSMTFVESPAPWRCKSCKCLKKTELNGAETSCENTSGSTSFNMVHYDLSTLCRSNLSAGDFEWINRNHTALSDYNQACGSQTIITNILYFCPGVMIGGLIFGMMGWSTGRKTPFLSALLTSMVASVICAASEEYIIFVILRILLGSSMAGYELLYFCWIVELVSRKWRPLAVGIQGIFGTAGLVIVFYINETWDFWRYKMVSVGMVSLVFIFVYAAVPESPYWLLAKGQDDVATMVLKRIAILNGRTYPDAQAAIPIIKTRERVMSFFRPKYKRVGALLCLNWVLVGMAYFHVFLTIDSYGTYGGDGPSYADLKNLNFIVALGAEVPAALIGVAVLTSLLGRKFSYILNLVIYAVCAAVSLLQYEVVGDWDVRRGAVLIGAKMSITAAKMILALWTAEHSPTTIRTLMFGLGLGSCSFGVVLASSLVFFDASPLVSVIIMLVLAVICIGASTQIYDTKNWNLPDHLFDVYKNMNINNADAVYSDLQSEVQTATVTVL